MLLLQLNHVGSPKLYDDDQAPRPSKRLHWRRQQAAAQPAGTQPQMADEDLELGRLPTPPLDDDDAPLPRTRSRSNSNMSSFPKYAADVVAVPATIAEAGADVEAGAVPSAAGGLGAKPDMYAPAAAAAAAAAPSAAAAADHPL